MAISCIVCESDLLVDNREIFIPHLYLAPRWNFVKMFDTGKTRIIGLPYAEKKLWRYYVKPFSCQTSVLRTDRRTDGQTELLYQYRASVCWRAIKTKRKPLSPVETMGFVVGKKYIPSISTPTIFSLKRVRLYTPDSCWRPVSAVAELLTCNTWQPNFTSIRNRLWRCPCIAHGPCKSSQTMKHTGVGPRHRQMRHKFVRPLLVMLGPLFDSCRFLNLFESIRYEKFRISIWCRVYGPIGVLLCVYWFIQIW